MDSTTLLIEDGAVNLGIAISAALYNYVFLLSDS